MNFRKFNWPARMDSMYVRLPNSQYKYFDQLLTEAVEDGFNLEASQVFGVITGARRPSGTIMKLIVIGEEFIPAANKRTTCPILYMHNPDGTPFFSVTSWHTVVTIPGNPVELHVKWKPGAGEHRAVLNIQTVQNHRQLDAIPELLGFFNSLKAGAGRPGDDAYARAYARLVNGECKTNREAYEMMIAEMDDASPEKPLLQNNPDAYKDGFENFKSAMKYQRKSRRQKIR